MLDGEVSFAGANRITQHAQQKEQENRALILQLNQLQVFFLIFVYLKYYLIIKLPFSRQKMHCYKK